MSEDELIAKGREHLKTHFQNNPVQGLSDETFTRANVSNLSMVTFEAENREDTIEIVFDGKEGFVWGVAQLPSKRPKQTS